MRVNNKSMYTSPVRASFRYGRKCHGVTIRVKVQNVMSYHDYVREVMMKEELPSYEDTAMNVEYDGEYVEGDTMDVDVYQSVYGGYGASPLLDDSLMDVDPDDAAMNMDEEVPCSEYGGYGPTGFYNQSPTDEYVASTIFGSSNNHQMSFPGIDDDEQEYIHEEYSDQEEYDEE